MNSGFLDFNSYTFAGGFTVQKNRDLIIPDSLVLSQTMLVKWQIRNLAKGVVITQIPPAILSSSLEIPGLGVLEGDDYQIVASQTGRDRVQLITLDPSLPHKLVLSGVTELVTNSVLEFYTSHSTMAQFNNPTQVTTDLSPLVNAIQASTDAQVNALQNVANAPPKQPQRLVDDTYKVNSWDGTPSNHIAVYPANDRMGVSIYNPSTERVAVDLFLDINSKGSDPQHDGIIEPGGTYTLDISEANFGVLLYTLNGAAPFMVSINLEYPTAEVTTT
jgi:hypothetical protein